MELQFKLKAYFKTSADPAPAKDVIAALFEEANNTLLTKGAPEGQGAKVAEWKLGEDRIELVLESGKYVRVHDAIFRLKKVLAEALGKKYKIGIRGIEVESFTIRMPAERELKALKVPYIKSMENIEGGIVLELEVGEAEMKNRVPDRILTLLEEKIEATQYGAKAEHWNLLWQREPMEHPFTEDPTQAMMKEGWLKRGASRGQWIHGPQSTKIFRTFEKIVFDELLRAPGVQGNDFPEAGHLGSLDEVRTCQGCVS